MRTLLLAGGGLTHALFVANARRLLPDNIRVILVAPDRFVPYAGMLPGLVAGLYRFRDCHIDLGELCRTTGTELAFGRIDRLDLQNSQIRLDSGEVIGFDRLSLDTGLERPADVPGLDEHGLSARPISPFLPQWQEALARLQARDRNNPAHVGVVGGHEAGVEMALAIRERLRQDDAPKSPVTVHLIHSGGKLLPEFPLRAQLRVTQLLQEREIREHPLFEVSQLEAGQILTSRQQRLPMDEVVWCGSGRPGHWLSASGLTLNDRGRVQLNQHLQSVSHPHVFAAGEVGAIPGSSGHNDLASALGQAPVLAANLSRSLTEEPLRTFKPGRRSLTLITASHRFGVARYGNWVWGSRWVERWRRRRDRKIMANFPRP